MLVDNEGPAASGVFSLPVVVDRWSLTVDRMRVEG
jgi:hypothetical protein